jgi:hypothetical protein
MPLSGCSSLGHMIATKEPIQIETSKQLIIFFTQRLVQLQLHVLTLHLVNALFGNHITKEVDVYTVCFAFAHSPAMQWHIHLNQIIHTLNVDKNLRKISIVGGDFQVVIRNSN